MKRKDAIYLAITAVLVAASGVIVYSQLSPAKSKAPRSAKVEVVVPITPQYDSNALGQVSNPNKVKDFSVPVDLNSGIGNTRPFGP